MEQKNSHHLSPVRSFMDAGGKINRTKYLK